MMLEIAIKYIINISLGTQHLQELAGKGAGHLYPFLPLFSVFTRSQKTMKRKPTSYLMRYI